MIMLLCSVTVGGQNKDPKSEQQPPDLVAIVVSPAQAKEIRKLLDVLPETPGGTQQLSPMVDQILDVYRKRYTSVPEKLWYQIAVQLKTDFDADRLAGSLAPIYANHFSDAEIKELTAFFRSPVGRKWSQLMPQLQRESYNAGDALGYLMGERINRILIAKGYAAPAGL
jgi:hypothetical protein